MKCPIDGETLVMSERHGVEIDYCPKCRGVWLDRGELDKIIDTATGAMALPDPAPAPAPEPPRAAPEPQIWREPYRKEDRDERQDGHRRKDKRYRGRYSDDDDHRYSRKKRRKSFLEEIFDFD